MKTARIVLYLEGLEDDEDNIETDPTNTVGTCPICGAPPGCWCDVISTRLGESFGRRTGVMHEARLSQGR